MKRKPETVPVRISKELRGRLRDHVATTGQTMQYFVEEAVKEKLEKEKKR